MYKKKNKKHQVYQITMMSIRQNHQSLYTTRTLFFEPVNS